MATDFRFLTYSASNAEAIRWNHLGTFLINVTWVANCKRNIAEYMNVLTQLTCTMTEAIQEHVIVCKTTYILALCL